MDNNNAWSPDTQFPWGIIGHEWAVDLLSRRMAAGQAGHAYLITGPEQVGKQTLARRMAQTMNCTGEIRPCGACRSCTLIERGVHPDLHIIDSKGSSIKVDEVRDILQILPLRPIEARYRVAIVLNLQLATPSAADALLKTLEEPPSTTRILLTADVAEKLLPTIVSRCQVLQLRPVPAEKIAQAVTMRYDMLEDEADLLAWLSGGRPGWAIEAVEKPAILKERTEVLDDLIGILRKDRTGRFEFSQQLARSKNQAFILDLWQSWWRDILLLVEESHVHPVNIDRMEHLEFIASNIYPDEARQALRAVRSTIVALKKNANARLALDVMLLNMPYVTSISHT